MKLIAIQEMWYAGATRKPGDEFECSEADARIFTATDLTGGQKARKAADAPATVAAKSAQTKNIEPEQTESMFKAPAEPVEGPRPPRRRYMRRDLQAED